MIPIEEILERDNVILLDRPDIKRELDILRDLSTPTGEFTWASYNLGKVTMSEVVRREVPYSAGESEKNLVLLSVLRAGLFFTVGGVQRIDEIRGIPRSWGIVDAERGEDLDLTPYLENWEDFEMPVEYTAWKVPKTNRNSIASLDDPMLASTSTLRGPIDRLMEEKAESRRDFYKIISRSIFASAYGLERLSRSFPGMTFYTCEIFDGGINGTGLDKKGYIVDRDGNYACGDFGDRTANTIQLNHE